LNAFFSVRLFGTYLVHARSSSISLFITSDVSIRSHFALVILKCGHNSKQSVQVYAQNPLQTFPRSFPVDGSHQLVTDLLAYGETGIMDFGLYKVHFNYVDKTFHTVIQCI